MGIFRLVKGELKKIFLKPGIFVITALLVLALTLSGFIFNPTTRTDASILSIAGNKVSEIYSNSFGAVGTSTSQSSTYSKIKLESNHITPSGEIISFYEAMLSGSAISKKDELFELIKKISDEYTGTNGYKKRTEEGIATEEDREKIKTLIFDFKAKYEEYINGYNGFYYLLLETKEKENLDEYLSKCTTNPFISTMSHSDTINAISELKVFATLNEYVGKMTAYLPSKQAVEEAKSYYEKSKENLVNLETQIEQYYQQNKESKTPIAKKEFKELITRYYQCAVNTSELVKATINYSALSDFSDEYIQSLYQFQNEAYKTKYTILEQKTIRTYYLETNKYGIDYATPLSLNQTSNGEINVFDFMYFALEICSFIIIIYIVYLGATMIAGEYSNGTMKLLAIRPYSRRKILFAKLLATILVGMLFLFITFIVTFIAGGILYSVASNPILVIFNATSIQSISPILVILLFFLCKSVEICFYAIFAISISTWFKSNSGCVIVSILLYFVSFVLTMFTPSLGIVKYLPFVNTSLFGYFGSHLVSTTSNSIFVTMFSKVIANDMNFYISFAVILLFSVVLYVITSEIFARRDIK